jgi:hypothetical protein
MSWRLILKIEEEPNQEYKESKESKSNNEVNVPDIPYITGAEENAYYVDFYEERSGIYEFESGLSTEDAEHQAMNEIVKLYSDQNKVSIYSSQAKQFINQFRIEVNYV